MLQRKIEALKKAQTLLSSARKDVIAFGNEIRPVLSKMKKMLSKQATLQRRVYVAERKVGLYSHPSVPVPLVSPPSDDDDEESESDW